MVCNGYLQRRGHWISCGWDLDKKNQCAQLRPNEVVDVLVGLRRTQLGMLYCGLGSEELTNDITADLPITRTLLGVFKKPT